MRVDHHTYQKATTTAVTGVLLQLAIATTLLVFGLVDTGSVVLLFLPLCMYGIGCVVWLGLIILFYQEKMQRIEELEESELSRSRTLIYVRNGK